MTRLAVTQVAAGGDGIARADDGRVVFVAGALPGEVVEAQIVQQRRDFARAVVTEVLEPSPARVEPVCPAVALGCGGCGWQHVDPAAQPGLKASMVVDALGRLGWVQGAADLVVAAPALPAGGHRTTVRVAIADGAGRPGFRAASSHRVVPVDGCPAAHPAIDALLRASRFEGATEVTLRVGVVTGEGLVLADPSADAVRIGGWQGEALDLLVMGVDELPDEADVHGEEPCLHEVVDGVRLRVSATAFAQTRHDGAEALVHAVDAAIGPDIARGAVLYDLYGGSGLFAATVGRRFERVVTVERHGASHRDATVNLAGRRGVSVVADDVERWRPDADDLARARGRSVVVADPARAGLGRAGVASVVACEPGTVVLVSCDAAAAGRDVGLLEAEGYALERATVLDLFPWTPHVEVVSRLVRTER